MAACRFSVACALVVSVLLHASDVSERSTFAGPGAAALLRFVSFEPGSWLFALGTIVAIVVPAILLTRAISGIGSFSVLMEGDYVALLNCVLMSWTAAHLPLALASLAGPTDVHTLPVYLAANLYFAVLTALSVRTVLGTGLAAAAGMTAFGWGAALVGGAVFVLAGSLPRFLMSPFLLYYAYLMLGPNLRSLGAGLRSRQHLRRQLEIATTNPRDADAHYQLGCIFEKRRQYSDAVSHFERAIEIDPKEADAHLQLGRIAREQGRFENAIQHLSTAAALDDKLATSEVWRELGAACFEASRFDEAAAALAKYTDRRPYDPEGLYWYGKTLQRMDRSAEARELFERSIEAVKTMPSHRRAQVSKWNKLARGELRALR